MTYIALLGTHEHYIDSEGDRAVIGRVKHRASRRVLRARGMGVGILHRVSRRHREVAIANSNDQTTEIPAQTAVVNLRDMANAMTQVLAPILGSLPPEPPEPPKPRWRRVLDRVTGALTDPEWHRTARQCAGTTLMWGFTAAAFIVFGKAVLWVLFL